MILFFLKDSSGTQYDTEAILTDPEMVLPSSGCLFVSFSLLEKGRGNTPIKIET